MEVVQWEVEVEGKGPGDGTGRRRWDPSWFTCGRGAFPLARLRVFHRYQTRVGAPFSVRVRVGFCVGRPCRWGSGGGPGRARRVRSRPQGEAGAPLSRASVTLHPLVPTPGR